MCRKGKVHTVFWWRNLRERDHLEQPDVDGRIILIWIFRNWDGDIEWIDLAQNRERWKSQVNTVTNLRFPQNAGNFFTS
jgi:hypothetical protein